MHLVLLSVLCSVTVSVIIKLARRYSVNTIQMIAWNYPVAVLLSYYYLKPNFDNLTFDQAPVTTYVILGLLLPSLFVIIAASIRYTGIVRTEVAQRLSLFIPLIAAFFIFNEHPAPIKLSGVIVGLIAVVCSIRWHHTNSLSVNKVGRFGSWLYPLIVFFGMGVIDILFKHLAQYQGVSYKTSIFVVFVLCTLTSFLSIAYLGVIKKMRFSLSGTLWGILLGLFNFGNIIFYMRAHQALPDNPSVVFSGMNIGVIIVGAVTGIFLFGEKLSILNKVGLVLAIISVLIISL
ncbi:EamA family transporter [Olivibacter sp. SDN3]|uniref:EamA family transporter n=1 Tax=Olivibacter sp. SDN3 TaxID=2764720 RepID=UPI001651840C|nr:EamA family transporter [Olivibacter sp. SDN3]QNL48607.1 EamA family transporter [Olivibacter sp. SDN3]